MSNEKEQCCLCRCCEGYEPISIFDVSSINIIDKKLANQFGFKYVESDGKKFIVGWSLRFRGILYKFNIPRKDLDEFYVTTIYQSCICTTGCEHEVWRNRRKQKQESRDEDERALASGEKTRKDLQQENVFLHSLQVKLRINPTTNI